LLLDIVPHLPEYENRTRFCAENGDQATEQVNKAVGSTKAADGFFERGYGASGYSEDEEKLVPKCLLVSLLTFG
jgi:hypothetical protein